MLARFIPVATVGGKRECGVDEDVLPSAAADKK